MSKQQHEEEVILRFISHLQNKTGAAFGITGRDVPVASGRNYDYELTGTDGAKMAVELFRLVESEAEIKQSRAWSRVIQKLREILLGRKLRGYVISTPRFEYRKNELDVYVAQQAELIQQAISGSIGKDNLAVGGYEIRKRTNLETVIFSYSPGGRAIDPKGAALEQFLRLLPVKNRQLAVSGARRALLVVNWAMFVDADDAVQALSAVDFSQFPNIDAIFYEVSPAEFVTIFDRSVYEAIRNRATLSSKALVSLLSLNLRYLLASNSDAAFEYIKAVSDAAGNMLWLDDTLSRENVVVYAENQVKQGKRIDDALWVLNTLQNDPNPDPAGESEYHARILQNEDVRFITTVRGHLCWLMSHLVVQNTPGLYTGIIGVLERYAKEPNLYIRIQATFPLTELVTRRRASKNPDGSPFDWDQEERLRVRRLAFDMLRENTAHPRVMEAVLHVFSYLRDVNEREAEEILQTFLAIGQDYILQDLAALVVYFALFRRKQWPDDPPFDPKNFIVLLKDQIVSGDKAIRASLAWHFWKTVSEKHLPYSEIREYFPLFWDGAYDTHLASTCASGIEELTTIAPDDALGLFKRMLERTKEHVEKFPGEHHWLNSVEEVLRLLAANPDELVAVVSTLKDLWMTGMYIGDPAVIFGSFRRVEHFHRRRVKEALKALYDEMKAAHPPLVDVNWSD
jgi:hypothetical protein